MEKEIEIEKTIPVLKKILELKKHVAVIHSSNKLTLLQRKIANALLFNAYDNLQKEEEHVIHIAKLCELIGYHSHDYKSIKNALVNLLSTVLEWNLIDGERLDVEGIWNASSIIADASIEGPVCTYSYSNKMRKLLYRPNIYGRLDMLVQAKFQSGYGLALYENCNRFQDIGKTPWLDLVGFRKLMGVKEGKYKVFRDFKTRVLDKAVEEVNKYSSFIITPQLRKQNRQVAFIQFLIKKSNSASVNETEWDSEVPTILKTQFGFSQKEVKETIEFYDENYIREKIDIVRLSPSFQNGKVKNLTRYLLSALRENYQPNKNSAIAPRVSDAQTKSAQISSPHTDIIKLTEFRRFQDKQLFSLFYELPEQERSIQLKHFEKSLMGIYRDLYLRSGLENLLIQEQLCLFLRKIKHSTTEQLLTFDAWLSQDKKSSVNTNQG